jgi:hypothetical protein
MAAVVLDTDVASSIIKHRLSASLSAKLIGSQEADTFVTIGELTKRSLMRNFGRTRPRLAERATTAAQLGLPTVEVCIANAGLTEPSAEIAPAQVVWVRGVVGTVAVDDAERWASVTVIPPKDD